MQKVGGVVQSKGGRVVVGAVIQFYLAGTVTPATMYSDAQGTKVIPAGALKSDNEGEYGAYVANGRYDIKEFVQGRVDGEYLDVLVYDPGDIRLDSGSLVGNPGWDEVPILGDYTPLNAQSQALLNRFSLLDSAQGASRVQTIQLGTGAVARTIQDELRDRVSVKQFGAVGDGVADDTAAIQAAWTAAGTRSLFLPAGEYRITQTLTGPLTMLNGEGPGRTIITFENFSGKDGLVFQAPATMDRQGGVTGMTIRPKGQNGRYGISTPRGATLNNLRPKFQFSNLAFTGMANTTGFAQDYGWEWMIDHGDCWGSYVNDIDAVGTYIPANNPTIQPEQGFMRMHGLQGLLSIHVSCITAHNVKYGLEIKDRVHWFFRDLDLADTYKGIYSNRDDSTTNYGEGTIQGVVVNAQLRGVDLEDRIATMCNHLTVNRSNAGFDHGQEWIGLRLEDANKCNLSNIKIYSGFNSSGGRFTGLQVGIEIAGGSNLTLSNYAPQALDRCLRTKVSAETSAIPSGISIASVAAETNIAGSVLFDFQAARAVQVAGVTWSPSIAPSVVAQYGDATTARNVDIDGIRVFGLSATTGISGRPEYVSDFGAATDEKLYAWVNDNGDLRLQLRTDSEGSAVNAVLINRTGMVVDQIELRGTALKFNSTQLGFYGGNPIAKPSVTGSRAGNAALASVLTQLAALGLITDSTTA